MTIVYFVRHAEPNFNYYEPSFDYSHFEAIRSLMPWIVQLTFDGAKCIAIEYFNVF